MKPEYILTLTSEQAREINVCLELLMRWKLKQPDLVAQLLLDYRDDVDEYLRKKEKIIHYLKQAMDVWVPSEIENEPGMLKDDEWHKIYNIYQVIRHAIHDCEYPNSTGVDSYPPMNSGGAGLPKIEWRLKHESTP